MAVLENVQEFAYEHPIATVGIGLATVALVFYAMSGSDKTPTTVVAQPADTSAAAAALDAAQISANAGTSQAQIAADAATSQANIAAGMATAAYNAQSAGIIAQANSATAIAQSHDQAATTQAGDATIGAEFSALASFLGAYGSSQNAALTAITGQGASVVQEGQRADAENVQAQLNDYYHMREVGIRNGYPGIGTFAFGGSAIPIVAGTASGSGAGGGSLTAAGAAGFNSIINTAANAVDNKDMNALIAQLTAKVGDGVAFHS